MHVNVQVSQKSEFGVHKPIHNNYLIHTLLMQVINNIKEKKWYGK